MARPSGRPVRDEVLAAARPLIQRAGVDGFSYADIAAQLNIKAPSIHHHFPTKDDLVAEVATEYRRDFAARVVLIEEPSVSARLMAYADLFDDAASAGLVCLCGAIAAEWPNIASRPREEVELFFAEQLSWLTAELDEGVRARELLAFEDSSAMAQLILATLEGSMLMARTQASADAAKSVMATLLATLTAR